MQRPDHGDSRHAPAKDGNNTLTAGSKGPAFFGMSRKLSLSKVNPKH
jgi:hypothetical protein